MKRGTLLLCIATVLLGVGASAEEGAVTLPADRWEQMLAQLEAAGESVPPDVRVCPLTRRVEGSLRKGLFSARLTARFEVLDDRGHIRVPVLDSAASLGEVSLDGQQTSLLREGGYYTVGVNAPGIHEVSVRFFLGQEQDRFSRNLRFNLPTAGTTTVAVLVPEQDIEPRLAQGALEPPRRSGGGTQLVAHLDATGVFDLSWKRTLTHREQEAVRTEAKVNTLFTIGEALVTGMAVFDFDILEGETDRIDLELPPNIEVLGVDGPAVLQWHTEAKSGSRLSVLLRYLVDKRARVAVRFQFPVESFAKPVALRLPLSSVDTPMTGYLGVLAPTGLDVQVATAEKVQLLTLRDLPTELTDLTSSPLLLGFSFNEPPAVTLTMKRHSEVELTSTIIDELQASTVVVADGTEITKLKLRIRNNTRQYLTMQLPPGALLTHSLIDGSPVRPAVGQAGESLLFPLRQSERIGGDRSRTHTVVAGETLSDISNFYYTDPTGWGAILEANPDELDSAADLYPGQRLSIPARQGATFDESSFIIELAYKRQRSALGGGGRRRLVLPSSDVDTVKVVWHLYLPTDLLPLSFDANLTQYSSIRYDPFRRVLQFLDRVPWVRSAWAGGKGAYQNILRQRKSIYVAETQQKQSGEVVLASFPLVGERYRFKRILPDRARPSIAVTYVDRGVVTPVRWLALVAAFVMALVLLHRRRSQTAWIVAAVGVLILLVVAHYFLGVHRRLIWGVDLALLVTWVQLRARPLWARGVAALREPWALLKGITLRNLFSLFLVWVLFAVLIRYPLLLSLIMGGVLFWGWRLALRAQREEVSHA